METTTKPVSEPQESSTESDELSASYLEDDLAIPEDLHFDDGLIGIIDAVSIKLLTGFRLSATYEECHKHDFKEILAKEWESSSGIVSYDNNSDVSQKETSTSTSDTVNLTNESSVRSNKRGRGILKQTAGNRSNQDDRDDEDDEGNVRLPKKFRTTCSDSGRKLLACPFWKRDAPRHRDCFKRKLDGIPRVKQHLRRTHYTGNHCCERCKTVFVDNVSYQAHLRQQCTFKEVEVPEWISHQTRLALAKKSKPYHSESEKWFEIWGLLFPGTPAPSSAYIDHNLSEDLCEFRSYAQEHGPRVLREELESVGVRFDMDSSESREGVINAAIQRGEEQLLEAWLSSRSLSAESSMESPEHSATSCGEMQENHMSGQVEVETTFAGVNTENLMASQSLDNLPDDGVAIVNNQNQEAAQFQETGATTGDLEQIEEMLGDDGLGIGEDFDRLIDFWPGAMGGLNDIEAQFCEDIQGLYRDVRG
ncbi:hypothetical protein PG991_010767 [Apiospora marii]|uniref:C2H2-type domain-containing protein n=1 Tax=Apiospora marii TaxID=335849 RepID=A0ABR1RC90_9PEZI